MNMSIVVGLLRQVRNVVNFFTGDENIDTFKEKVMKYIDRIEEDVQQTADELEEQHAQKRQLKDKVAQLLAENQQLKAELKIYKNSQSNGNANGTIPAYYGDEDENSNTTSGGGKTRTVAKKKPAAAKKKPAAAAKKQAPAKKAPAKKRPAARKA